MELDANLGKLRTVFRNRPGARDHLVRDAFYHIAPFFKSYHQERGTGETVIAAAQTLDWMMDQETLARIRRGRAPVFEFLLNLAQAEPKSRLDEAVIDLCAGRFVSAALEIGRLENISEVDLKKYRAIAPSGPEAGLAAWQIINPFYFMWAALPPGSPDVSERWRDSFFNEPQSLPDPAVDGPLSVEDRNDESTPDILKRLNKALNWTPDENHRVLECGIGHGGMLTPLIRVLGINPGNYRGFDLHDARVSSARQRWRAAFGGVDDGGADLEERIFALDILADNARERLAALAPLDLLVSASFSNVFDDTTLPRVLTGFAAAQPRFIADISVITRWGYCIGRLDTSDIYARIGYEAIASAFETPAPKIGDDASFWLPRNYWANRRLMVYRKKA